MKISIAQINPIVGDFEYNLNLIKKFWLSADKKSDIYPSRMKKMARRTTVEDRKPILNRCEPEIRQCNNARASFLMGIILFPELCVCGYNPQDLALRAEFIEDCENSVKSLVEYSKNLESAAIIGSISRKEGKIYNSAFLIYQGQILHSHNKIALPNYGVFDDKRIFSAGDEIKAFEFNGQKVAIVICEDMWEDELYKDLKSEDIYPSRMKKMARRTIALERKPILNSGYPKICLLYTSDAADE